MAESLSEKRFEEFLQELPNANREEIAQCKQLVKQYFLGQISVEEFKGRRLTWARAGSAPRRTST